MNTQITGTVEKVAKRDRYRLVIKTASGSVIADFAQAPTVKLRKGSTVSVTGNFKSSGADTMLLTDCSIAKPETIRAEAVGEFA